jgi:iron complex transport system substrate-binding protein
VIAFPQATGAVCALALALSGCGSEGAAARGNRTFVDMAGRTVVLPDSVKRVCSNGFSLNQLLLMLGAAPRLCATTEAVRQAPWFRHLAPRVDSLPRPFSGEAGGDAEALLRIRPDLVVLWNDDGFAARLREAGVAVLVVRFSKPEEMDSGVRLLGAALGGDASRRAARWCSLRDSVDSLVRSRLADLPEASRRKVYYAADDPQNTEGGPSLVTSWIARSGGRNVAAAIPTVRAQIAMEQILSWNPDLVVSREEDVRRRILSDPVWKDLAAVFRGEVHACPRGVTAWCTRSGEAALQPLWAASILHPDRFPDARLDSLASRFFRDFYDHPSDSAEIASILAGTVPAWMASR